MRLLALMASSLAAVPPSLRSHVLARVRWGLAPWAEGRRARAEELAAALLEGGDQGPRRLAERAEALAKALRAHPDSFPLDGSVDGALLERIRDAHLTSVARRTGIGAPSHREGRARPADDLCGAVYAWARGAALAHFRRNGARKTFLQLGHAEDPLAPLAKDLLLGARDERLRVLDVCSLGDPLAAGPDAAYFSATPVFGPQLPSGEALAALGDEPFDAALFPLALSRSPPAARAQALAAVHRLLAPPPDAPPHRLALLLVADRFGASDPGNGNPLLERWRRELAAMGFTYLRHSRLQEGGQGEGVLGVVFLRTPVPPVPPAQGGAQGGGQVGGLLLAPDSAPPLTHRGARVGVVGGGIGGAALALLLQRRGMEAVVFERDADVEVAARG